MKIPNKESAFEEYFELDVLRGWREVRDPELVAPHALPVLATLVQLGTDHREIERITIHGPDAILGRFQPQHGPVDLVPGTLEDHENYRLGVPHLYLRYEENGWGIRLLSTTSTTFLEGEKIAETDRYYAIKHGDVLQLGVATFVFESNQPLLSAWFEKRSALLNSVDRPAVFLKRNGGVCGPFLRLSEAKPSVIGRTAPRKGEIPGTQGWVDASAPDWDLAGLEEWERKHIGFQHARVGFIDGDWCIEPISNRQWTFVNRSRVRGLTCLRAGDEIGLGSVLFYFHDGQPVEDSVILGRDRISLPEVIAWNDGHVSSSAARREKASSEHKP